MADKDDANNKKKKKSIIASLDLKNYKAKYTDSYGLGKPNEIDLDNFLVAEPDKNSEPEKIIEKKITEDKPKIVKLIETKPLEVQKPSEPVTDRKPLEHPVTQKPTEPVMIPQKKSAPEINTRVDKEFERRVNAEAENDFYDEKPPQKTVGTFRSGALKRPDPVEDFEEVTSGKDKADSKTNRKLNLREPITVNVRHEVRDRNEIDEEFVVEVEEKKPQRRTETYGIVISAVALVYSVVAKDKPLMFLSVSLLLYLARPIIAAPFGKYSHSIENAIKGFSMALFFGSIFFIFF